MSMMFQRTYNFTILCLYVRQGRPRSVRRSERKHVVLLQQIHTPLRQLSTTHHAERLSEAVDRTGTPGIPHRSDRKTLLRHALGSSSSYQ